MRRGRIQTRHLIFAGLLLALVFNGMIRWRLRNVPLERDEGEYAYAGQLLLHGESFYKHAYNVALKLPGTCGMYALIMGLLGETTAAIHLGIIPINLASICLVFVLTRRFCGDVPGVIGAATFSLLSINPAVLGTAAHATHFVILPGLAGTVLLSDSRNASGLRFFLAGLCFGLALLMKQTGAAFFLFGLICTIGMTRRIPAILWKPLAQRCALLTIGTLLPLLLVSGVIAICGDFPRFWFWTFQYAGTHETIFHWSSGLRWMIHNLAGQFSAAPALWSLAIVGLVSLFWSPAMKHHRLFLASFAICSFLAVCPGWYFRGHYFIQLLPAAAVLAGIAFHGMRVFLSWYKLPWAHALPCFLFLIAFVSSVIQWNDIYFRLDPFQVSRAVYGTNPFPEAVEVGRYIERHCAPDATIAVIGSESEIYFYSHRRSATGYICTYPLVEQQPFASRMTSEMIQEVELGNPAFVIFVNIPASWIQSTAPANRAILDWFEKYQTRLELAGYASQLPNGQVAYHWLDRTEQLQAPTDYSLAVYRQK